MNKVFIRTRQIDNNKQLPILIRENDDLSDFNEYSNISRSSQILSGMDKGEESELHLQEVLRELQYEKTTANTAIPIPDVHEESEYNTIYQTDFILPKNYIRLKTLEFEDEFPEYDLDEDDEEWMNNSNLNITPLKFEKIIEEFEKTSNQRVLLFDEAKSLLRHEPYNIVTAIYDYWLSKRILSGQPLIPSVKAEKAERCNNAPIDPYIAFRKRSEKMTTRKNRRVDESSFQKMVLLKYHMEKLSDTIKFVFQREETKRQITQIECDIFRKRYESRDYNKLQLRESEVTLKSQSIKLADTFKSAQRSREENHKETTRKRSFSKTSATVGSSLSARENSSEDIDFTFRPMAKCKYLPSKLSHTVSNSDCCSDSDGSDPQSFSMSKLSHLPPSLHSLHTPVRFRLTRYGDISIDLHHSSQAPSFIDRHLDHHIPPPPLSAMPQGPHASKLYTLYNRYVNCGLPPLDIHPHNNDQNCNYGNGNQRPQIPQSAQKSLRHNHKSSASPKPNFDQLSANCCGNHGDGGGGGGAELKSFEGSKFSETHCQNSDCNGVCSRVSNQSEGESIATVAAADQDKCQRRSPSSKSIASQHHQNGESLPLVTPTCTYQNQSTRLHGLHRRGSLHAFSDTDRQINGRKRSPTVIKDVIDARPNQSSTVSSAAGLNCWQSLIPRDDIDAFKVFYSKTNGHSNNHHYGGHGHTHNNNNNGGSNNNGNNQKQSSKWRRQGGVTDGCLAPTLLPIWKAEPHVMTSVNKMA